MHCSTFTFNMHVSLDEIFSYLKNEHVRHIVLANDQEQIVMCSSAFLQVSGYLASEINLKPIQQIIKFMQPLSFTYEQFVQQSEIDTDTSVKVVGKSPETPSFRYNIKKLQHESSTYYLIFLIEIDSGQHGLLQQFARTIMQDVNLGVLLINKDFTLHNISDMACRVLGVERNHVISKPIDEIFGSVPAEYQLVQRTILDGHVVRNHAVSWMNNRERYELLMDSNVLRDDRGQVTGAYVLFKDVTNLRSLEQQVQRSDRLAMIGQIAAGTAHEIRNPLTSIKGFLQMLNTTFKEKEMLKEEEYTKIMLMEIDRINELVSEFLMLSKPRNVSFEQVDIPAVLSEIMPIIKNEALLHAVTVCYKPAQNVPKVIADRELLKQVYLNICKNGIEAMTDGGCLTISERVDMDERRLHIDFHDTGPGIPVFVIDKIFDPFFTTKANGTGLGLSVCQRIIHEFGGTVRVSCKGFGTTFTVSIPFP